MNHQRASIWLGLSFWVTPVSFAAVFYFCGLVTSEDRPSGEHFPIDQYGYISIPVQLFGEKLNFCLDTGHSETQFHPDLRDQLGPKSKEKEVVTGVGNKVLEFFEHPELLIGDKSPETFRTTDLAICARSGSGYSDFWRRYNGLLGMSYLRSKVLHIKFDESFAEFLVPALNDESHTERMRFSNSVPHILLRVSDEGFQSFAIDTGAGTNVGLSHDLFRILVNKRKISLAPSIAQKPGWASVLPLCDARSTAGCPRRLRSAATRARFSASVTAAALGLGLAAVTFGGRVVDFVLALVVVTSRCDR